MKIQKKRKTFLKHIGLGFKGKRERIQVPWDKITKSTIPLKLLLFYIRITLNIDKFKSLRPEIVKVYQTDFVVFKAFSILNISDIFIMVHVTFKDMLVFPQSKKSELFTV